MLESAEVPECLWDGVPSVTMIPAFLFLLLLIPLYPIPVPDTRREAARKPITCLEAENPPTRPKPEREKRTMKVPVVYQIGIADFHGPALAAELQTDCFFQCRPVIQVFPQSPEDIHGICRPDTPDNAIGLDGILLVAIDKSQAVAPGVFKSNILLDLRPGRRVEVVGGSIGEIRGTDRD